MDIFTYIMLVKKKILIFTATYNEKDNIEPLIRSINFHNPEVDILIIDDNSPDLTFEKVKDLKKEYKNIYLKIRSLKSGLDTAHKEAYEYALKHDYDYLITMDADLSHDPSEINNFIKYLDEFPFVIGSRYIEGGKCEMRGRRLMISKVGNKFIKKILNINCHEFTTSFRGFNLKRLNKFHLNLVSNKGYSFFMGTIYEIDRLNFEIKEIPITFKDRKMGSSKIPKIEIFRTLKNLFLLILK
jgi:Glycosyltransferases involved in cell wall biogenesis